MFKELTELLSNYENKLVDEKFIREASDVIISGVGLKGYIEGVSLDANNIPFGIACYNPTEKQFYLNAGNRKDLDKFLDLLFKDSYSESSRRLFQNLMFLNTIFHELDHAILYKDLEEGSDKLLCQLYKVIDIRQIIDDVDSKDEIKGFKNLALVIKYLIKYSLHHDYVSYETRAILNSNDLSNLLIEELYNSNMNVDDITFNDKVMTILSDYEIIRRYNKIHNGVYNSPSYDFCCLFPSRKEYFTNAMKLYSTDKVKSFELDSSKYSFYVRTHLGLQISEKEYNDFYYSSCLPKYNEQYKILRKYNK